MSNHAPIGRHVLLDLFDCKCDPEMLKFWSVGAPIVNEASKHFTVLDITGHQFRPVGWSATVLLSESHLSFHTWADLLFLSADLFTCGAANYDAAVKAILDGFKPERAVRADVVRGTQHPQMSFKTIGVENEVQSHKR